MKELLLTHAEKIRDEYESAAYFSEEYAMVKWSSAASMHNRFKLAKTLLPFSQAKTWLDIGCGPGSFQAYIATLFLHLKSTALDITPALIKYAQNRKDVGNCNFILGDFAEFNYSQCDIITCIGVLQRTNFSSKTFFEKAYGLLNTQGFLFLDTKNALWEKFTNEELVPDAHLQWFKLEDLCQEAEKCGFELVEKSGFDPHTGSKVTHTKSSTIYVVLKKG